MSWLGSGERERSCCGFLCAQTEYKSFIMGRHRRGPELLLAWSKVPERRKKEREKKRERGGLSSNFIITLGVCHSCAVTLLFCCDGTDSSLWNSVKLSCLLIQSDIHGSPLLPPHTPTALSLSYSLSVEICDFLANAIFYSSDFFFSSLIHKKNKTKDDIGVWKHRVPVCTGHNTGRRAPLWSFGGCNINLCL